MQAKKTVSPHGLIHSGSGTLKHNNSILYGEFITPSEEAFNDNYLFNSEMIKSPSIQYLFSAPTLSDSRDYSKTIVLPSIHRT